MHSPLYFKRKALRHNLALDPVSATIATVGGGLASSMIGADAAGDAADAQAQSAANAQALQKEMFDKQVELQEPWRQGGITALGQLGAGTANGGDLNRDFTMADFNRDPGYAFRRTEGLKGVEASAAARGGALSGGALKGIEKYGQDLASQEYGSAYNRFNADRDRRFNRLSSIAGLGQTATRDVASGGQNYANQAGDLMTQAGNARASGYVGSANAINQGIGSVANWYGAQGGGGGNPYTSPNLFGNYSNPSGSGYSWAEPQSSSTLGSLFGNEGYGG